MKINLSVLLHAAAEAATNVCSDSGVTKSAVVDRAYQNYPTQLALAAEGIKTLIEKVTGETVEIIKR